jgi:hypothetical protein
MIRFVVSVLDHVDSVTDLRRLYAVFFHWLDYAELRPYLAHILVRITLREHCVPFRVRRLASLLARSHNDRALIALAAVFQCYAPLDIAVPAEKVSADASTFAGAHAVDQAAWAAEIALARSRAGASVNETANGVPLRALADVTRGLATHGAPATSAVVTIDDVDTAATLVDSLDRLELPDRMSAVLSNEWLQHYVALAPNESALMRVQQWLAFTLDERARWRGGGECESLFAALAQLTRFVGETLPVVERFLSEYLRTASADANFMHGSDSTLFSLLTLVEHVHPMPFEQLHARILAPLQQLFYTGGVSVKSRILESVRRLCAHWASVEWADVRREALQAPDNADDLTMVLKRYPIGGVRLRFDHLATLQALVRFNERLCVLALQAHRHHALLQHQALSTFEFIVQLHRRYAVPFCCAPPMALVTSALFSNNASAVSRVCALIVELAAEVSAIRSESAQSKATRQGSVVASGAEHRERVNDFLLHLSALLWQKGLFAEDKGRKGGAAARQFRAAFGLGPESVAALQARVGSETIESFGVARHPALAPFAAEFARSLNDGNDTAAGGSRKRRAGSEPAAQVQEQRKQFVVWLAQHEQLTGIERFLTEFTTTTSKA